MCFHQSLPQCLGKSDLAFGLLGGLSASGGVVYLWYRSHGFASKLFSLEASKVTIATYPIVDVWKGLAVWQMECAVEYAVRGAEMNVKNKDVRFLAKLDCFTLGAFSALSDLLLPFLVTIRHDECVPWEERKLQTGAYCYSFSALGSVSTSAESCSPVCVLRHTEGS